VPVGEFLTYFSQDRVPLTVAWSMICVTSVLGFVFVPAVYDLLKRHVHRRDMRELFRAVTVYALIGFGFLEATCFEPLNLFAATASAISAPVWGIALGRQLIRAAPPDTTSSGLQGR